VSTHTWKPLDFKAVNKLFSFKVVMAFCIAIGLLLRLVLIVQSGWRIDYDEAMMGLLGLRVLRGEWMAFIPAQPTLGSLEAYLLAASFKIFGPSVISFRLVSLALSAGYILTTGLLAQRAFGSRAGTLAAMLAAIAPPYMIVTGLKTWGGTIETIILGNCLFLIADYVLDKAQTDRARRIALAMTGLITGIMFWLAWLGFYYILPVALLLIWRGRKALRLGWWIVLLAFFIGSAPFWIVNVRESFPTFTTALKSPSVQPDTLGAVVTHLGNDLVPRLVTGDPAWQTSGPRGLLVLIVVYYAGLLSLLTWPRWGARYHPAGSNLRWMLAVFVVMLPLVYLFSGYARNALNPWGVDATGRYVLMIHTAFPIGVAALSVALRRLPIPGARLIGPALVLLIVGLNLLGNLRVDGVKAFDSPYYNRLPDSLTPLITYLEQQGIAHVWTDVGIGQVLMFDTNERIWAADYYDVYIARGPIRFPDALAAVKAAPRTAFVIPVRSDQTDPPLQRALDAAHIPYTYTRVIPTLAVYIPDRPIEPAVIASGLGYQY
jgi:hypothetical protein